MSETLNYGQLFDNFDEFEQVFQEFTKKTYTLWTTVSSALIKGSNNYKYMHYKCIHYRTIDDLTTKSNGVRPKQAYVAPCGCLAEIRINF